MGSVKMMLLLLSCLRGPIFCCFSFVSFFFVALHTCTGAAVAQRVEQAD